MTGKLNLSHFHLALNWPHTSQGLMHCSMALKGQNDDADHDNQQIIPDMKQTGALRTLNYVHALY